MTISISELSEQDYEILALRVDSVTDLTDYALNVLISLDDWKVDRQNRRKFSLTAKDVAGWNLSTGFSEEILWTDENPLLWEKNKMLAAPFIFWKNLTERMKFWVFFGTNTERQWMVGLIFPRASTYKWTHSLVCWPISKGF